MAGTAVPELYCWEMTIDDLNIYLASTRKGAVKIGFTLKWECDGIAFFKKQFPHARLIKDSSVNKPLIREIKAALLNRQRCKNLELDISCSLFQLKALKAIARIPFGETKTYGEVASMIGRPKGARAVGQAMKRNPLPLIFP
ncbi:MAG: methylated-DNA--[protein]-cysteine S-methyltransferase [Deltaproteobacteria bacterium]|nr:methylated-DNA--[protein]-cysteine S-methyltransferase [Deltaproteobacteria bacterium]